MIISTDSADKRLKSSNNLMNRLSELRSVKKSSHAMDIFTNKSNKAVPTASSIQASQESPEANVEPFARQQDAKSFAPFEEPTTKKNPTVEGLALAVREQIPRLEDLVSNSTEQVKLGLAHDTALRILQESMEHLHTRLQDVKADKLTQVISVTSKVVEGIRRERIEVKKNQGVDKEVHYHFYTPEQKKIEDYEVIDVVASHDAAQEYLDSSQ
jgi:hypothetical protein